jgi:hypothetical protein
VNVETFEFYCLLRQIVEFIFQEAKKLGLDYKPWPDQPNPYRGGNTWSGLFLEIDYYGHVDILQTPWGKLKLFERVLIEPIQETELTLRILQAFQVIEVGETPDGGKIYAMTWFGDETLPISLPVTKPVDFDQSREEWAQFTARYQEKRQN